ncbi:MAG TPA: alpha/beta hydrolase, partial [Ramlibacter sp.]|nr:alpha/beta hydrolase [Ramlibacter sp.]
MKRLPLLLLPGLLCDAAVWTHQRAALAHVVDCSIPDYGDLDTIAAMAEAALAAAPPGPLLVAGHSMGGRVALEIVRLAQSRIQGLALLDTGTEPLAEGMAGEQERARRMALLEIARQEGMRSMGQQWAQSMVHPARVGTPVFEDILAMIERSTPGRFAAQLHALLGRPDARPVFAAVTCPTLLACGRQDTWSPLERHERMQQALPHARLVPVENAGHMTTME